MTVVVLILLGLCFGSFVNALVWRLHTGKDWVSGRSECPHCHHILAAKDLVPVLSWLSLRGKCRYCHKPIPDSPLVELTLPLLFVVSYICWPDPLSGSGLFSFGLWLVFLVGFLALAVYDLKWFLLPDVIVFPLIGLAVFEVIVKGAFLGAGWGEVFGSAIGAAVLSGLFLGIFWLSKGKWIGFGDVKLALILGVLAGGALPALLVLFVASMVGTLSALPLVLAGKANRKSHLPSLS
jgi:leader peptidase (prepilin peptidase)/N-methyltransferase